MSDLTGQLRDQAKNLLEMHKCVLGFRGPLAVNFAWATTCEKLAVPIANAYLAEIETRERTQALNLLRMHIEDRECGCSWACELCSATNAMLARIEPKEG